MFSASYMDMMLFKHFFSKSNLSLTNLLWTETEAGKSFLPVNSGCVKYSNLEDWLRDLLDNRIEINFQRVIFTDLQYVEMILSVEWLEQYA